MDDIYSVGTIQSFEIMFSILLECFCPAKMQSQSAFHSFLWLSAATGNPLKVFSFATTFRFWMRCEIFNWSRNQVIQIFVHSRLKYLIICSCHALSLQCSWTHSLRIAIGVALCQKKKLFSVSIILVTMHVNAVAQSNELEKFFAHPRSLRNKCRETKTNSFCLHSFAHCYGWHIRQAAGLHSPSNEIWSGSKCTFQSEKMENKNLPYFMSIVSLCHSRATKNESYTATECIFRVWFSFWWFLQLHRHVSSPLKTSTNGIIYVTFSESHVS